MHPKETIMRISKRQLRNLIKEESRKLLREQGPMGDEDSGHVSYEEMVLAINTNIEEALRHDAMAKVIYDVMLEAGWIE